MRKVRLNDLLLQDLYLLKASTSMSHFWPFAIVCCGSLDVWDDSRQLFQDVDFLGKFFHFEGCPDRWVGLLHDDRDDQVIIIRFTNSVMNAGAHASSRAEVSQAPTLKLNQLQITNLMPLLCSAASWYMICILHPTEYGLVKSNIPHLSSDAYPCRIAFWMKLVYVSEGEYN